MKLIDFSPTGNKN